MSAVLTMSGAVASVAVLTLNVRSWWKGKREFAAAVPFSGGLIQGASWLLCGGGLLGWVAVRSNSATSAAGDDAVRRVTGTGGGALASGSMGALTPAGACTVVVALVVGIFVFKSSGKTVKKKIIGGLFVGMTLCATAGFAHLMQWVPDAYNGLGGFVQNLLSGRVSL